MSNKIDIRAGAVLRRLRVRAGLSQTDLAKKAKLSYKQIAKYETGLNRITISKLFEICEVLGTTPPAFITILHTEINKKRK